MATLPRGIRLLKWKNSDNTKSIRYRVRVKKGDFLVDRCYDDEDRARALLEDTKTPQGRLLILQGRDKASMMVSEVEKQAAEFIKQGRATLNDAIQSYLRNYVNPSAQSPVEKVRLTANSTVNRLLNCRNTQISYIKPGFTTPTGPLASLREFSKGFEKKAVGDFYLDELTAQQATEYVRVRLAAGKAKSTVKREVALFRSVINKLEHTDDVSFKRLMGYNAFAKADKTLTKGGEKRRRVIINKEQEEELLVALATCKNPNMRFAFAAAIATGMRRAELLSIRWSQVDLERGVITLEADQTKANDERLVILLPDAVEVFKSIPRVEGDDDVFHLKISNFKSTWKRMLARADLEEVHFHDTRRSFISRVLKTFTTSPVAIAEMVGAKNVANLQKRTIERIEQADMVSSGKVGNDKQLRVVTGHQTEAMQSRYAVLAPEKKTVKKPKALKAAKE